MKSKLLIFILPNLIGLLWLYNQCLGAELFFVDSTQEESVEYQQTDLACRFYGINLKRITVEANNINSLFNDITEKVGGFVITAKALPHINRYELPSFILDKEIPILIIGLTPQTDRQALKHWSDGGLTGVREYTDIDESGFYKIADLQQLCLELSRQNIPFFKKFPPREFILELSEDSNIEQIIQVSSQKNNSSFPVFISGNFDGIETYFLSGLNLKLDEYTCWQFCTDEQLNYCQERFFEIAPLLMYLQYVFGEKCWHSIADYANLTIDDPWLIEPYGNLSYKELLKQMQKTDFHTTIAFIPWNYDRSREDVVKLFRENQDKFSISIHGNDHAHREFNIYDINLVNEIDIKTFKQHETKIKTAIARMERFSDLTGLSYERVMIFPQKIAPSLTLGLLKKYNFLATFNSNHIPDGAGKKKDPLSL